MTGDDTWSPAALSVCYVCRFLWCCIALGGCTYVVFAMNQTGVWYFLAVFLCVGDCKSYRSPAQMRADPPREST